MSKLDTIAATTAAPSLDAADQLVSITDETALCVIYGRKEDWRGPGSVPWAIKLRTLLKELPRSSVGYPRPKMPTRSARNTSQGRYCQR